MSVTVSWTNTLRDIQLYGCDTMVRGIMTKELVGHTTVFDMQYPVLTRPERALNYGFMAAEAAWILRGSDRLVDLGAHRNKWAQYSNDGVRLDGAYGPKISAQMRYVLDTLQRDPTSRQAVISIWRENPRESKDIPCTLSLQFLIRKDRLHLVVSMRSNDVWLGFPYDAFTFSMVASMVLIKLRKTIDQHLKLGICYFTAGSRHLYEKDQDAAARVGSLDHSVTEVHGSFWGDYIYGLNTPDDLLVYLCDKANAPKDHLLTPP